MRRIAYCSPVNPVESGISDYSEELLPYLGQYAEVVLFVARGVTPTNPHVQAQLEVCALDDLPKQHRNHPFDAIVYHMGNSPAHGTIYELAQQLPGVVVLHEWVLHHLKLWHAAERRKDVGVYLREMQARYSSAGERVARKMLRGQLQDAAFSMPLVEDVVERALGVISHSQFVAAQARALRASLPAAVVPMGVPLPAQRTTADARVHLGLSPDAFIWASFGHINPYKRMESALRAFKRFRVEHPAARYILVGSVSPSYDLQSLIQRLDLADAVTVTGYVSRSDFEHYVAAANLCLNLRFPTAGETSASLLRLLGAGRPTLVSTVGAFAELPMDVCAHVDVDWSETELILGYARLLHAHPLIARRLGENARAYVAREHTLERAAEGYLRFLVEVYGWHSFRKERDLLWEVEGPGAGSRAQTSTPQPVSAADPSPARPTNRVLQQVVADVGAAAAELGLAEADEPALQDVASTLADLLDEPKSSR